ncbi:S66 family peptidase [Cellulomonas fimi]|uniref:Peptidase U61 LD-carboxypeptidase A n=1 Tax=Cellulomonas fimi (strain ATCC 484 / DSM 20113 / JCM 1341 / CCUG 24087 / LMG 16345 / NBRC 15513 / NCIMB 8980 / NCTC 7547 / NRS-133) TaxID=590998 RepID=F4GYQ9_CELFA|nr:S66 peptidase family protein [Cellulomonas fimi]AEE44778.1 peptidase U61 LD-carboxypeptidase A [Cellulomonas fimi ATCC 484]NNH06082.1 LD-carboxypeptidase [Cellulomonas fimi]VEH27271.1 L,D-carboxypeptidase A [Cellulomonas fimi]
MIRYPRALGDGDVVAVPSPSAGVEPRHRARLDVAVEAVRAHGWDVRLGPLVGGVGIASGSPRDRADELTGFLTDPAVRAVVPPWGGEIALDLLPLLDWDALAADPTWFVGYSDVATLLLPLTLRTGVATLHGQNLMDTPYRVPAPLLPWTTVVTAEPGAVLTQGAAERVRETGFDDYADDPHVAQYTLDAPGGWTRVDAEGDVEVTGRLVGGCLETVSHLAGTPYGDVAAFADAHAPEGLVVYLEAAAADSADVTRRLLGLRYAGWFDRANAVLLGRTRGARTPGWTQHDAARHALGDLGVPVLADVDCGHVPPHLSLVNGALATVTHDGTTSRVVQRLV